MANGLREYVIFRRNTGPLHFATMTLDGTRWLTRCGKRYVEGSKDSVFRKGTAHAVWKVWRHCKQCAESID